METGNYLGKEEVDPTSKSSVQCTSVSTKQKYDFIIADWLQNRMILKREAVLLSQDIGKKKTPESGVLLPTVVHANIGQASTTKRNSAPTNVNSTKNMGQTSTISQ